MPEEQAEVASHPPGAAKVRPANYPWEEQHSGGSTPERREEMLDSFWQDVFPDWWEMVLECPWPKDQGDRNRLWEEREPGELPDSNATVLLV